MTVLPSPHPETVRVLLVDDEPLVLSGLTRILRTQRSAWEVQSAKSGMEALRILATKPFDFIVSDMRMPEMDGAALLERVRTTYPRTIRIVLSGFAERESALRAVTVAHQFLHKPCEPAQLLDTLERASSLYHLVNTEELRARIGSVVVLPPAPRVYQAITEAINKPNASAGMIAQILERDPALCAKVLQVANSAFFGLPQRTASASRAVTYLGTENVRNLVLSMETLSQHNDFDAMGYYSLAALQKQCLLAATLTRLVPGLPHELRDPAYTAALLHKVGILVIASASGPHFKLAVAKARKEQRPLWRTEKELFGITHAEVGAYLLGAWGLPREIVSAVATQYDREPADGSEVGIATAVRVAGFVADQVLETGVSGADEVTCEFDRAWLEALGMLDKVPALMHEARTLVYSFAASELFAA